MAVGATAPLDEARDTLANVDVFGEPVSTARFMGGRDHGILVPADAPPATPAEIAAVIAAGVLALPGLRRAVRAVSGEPGLHRPFPPG